MNPPPLPDPLQDRWTHEQVNAYLNQPMLDKGRPVSGTEGMTFMQIEDDILRGGRFRVFLWNFSLIVLSFQRTSGLRYIHSGCGAGPQAWPWTILSLCVGWWGIPWGIFFTIRTLYTNCMGGNDVTAEVVTSVVGPQRAESIMACATKPQADITLWLLRIVVLLIPLGLFVAVFNAIRRH